MTTTTEHYDIVLSGPLPLGILTTLTSMIGTAWPNAQIVVDRAQMPPGHQGTVFRIPRSDLSAPAPDTVAIQRLAEEAAQADAEGANDSALTHFDNTGLKGQLPEELSKLIASIALELFDGYPGANYLAIPVSLPPEKLPGSRRCFEVLVQRSEKPTPHTLRTRAEARVAELEQELAAAHEENARLKRWEVVEESPAELEGGR